MTPNPITLANWGEPQNMAWSYRHVRELHPTARVRGGERPFALTEATPHPGELAAERLLDDDATDGLIVLRDGHVVLEGYRRGLEPDDVHLLQSVSKSITGTLSGILVGRGLLSPDDSVTQHVPELAQTSFEGASVRNLLDMRVGTRFDENYGSPDSDIPAWGLQFGWTPGARPARDGLAYFASIPKQGDHGGRFNYQSIITDVLGLVLERASGARFAELLGRELWSPLGAETDADVIVDPEGLAIVNGGICVSLRDLARFGLMVLNCGAVDGRQVVPSDWLDDTLVGGPDSAEAFAQDEQWAPEMPGGHYRNQWWIPPGRHTLVGKGLAGQYLYIDRGTRTVVALLSTWPTLLDPGRRRAAMAAFRETSRQLAQ